VAWDFGLQGSHRNLILKSVADAKTLHRDMLLVDVRVHRR
jgi:hypothetical protein